VEVSGLFSGIRKELEERVMRTGITQAKDIARSCEHGVSVMYARKISQKMKDFGCVRRIALGLRIWWRMMLLETFPELFVRMMRFSGYTKFFKENRSKKFYE
jgi:hypothetical protein